MDADGSRISEGPSVDAERWLTAIGLLVTAEDSARRGAPWGWTTATILADTVTEILLSILAGLAETSGTRLEVFERLLAHAAEAAAVRGVPLPADLVREAQAVHRIRNTAAHNASDATLHDARRATTCARRLAVHVGKLRHGPGGALEGTGIATAVADLIGDLLPARYLRAAEVHARSGDVMRAADAAAGALEAAIRVAPMWDSLRTPPGLGMLMDISDELPRRLQAVERSIISLSLGLLPGELERLRSLVGTATVGGQPLRVMMVERFPAADEALRRRGAMSAVDEVATVVFRLWRTGLLDGGALLHPDVAAVQADADWVRPQGWRVAYPDRDDPELA